MNVEDVKGRERETNSTFRNVLYSLDKIAIDFSVISWYFGMI